MGADGEGTTTGEREELRVLVAQVRTNLAARGRSGLLGVALTPTYAQIGIAAPILVVLFRLVQGFALGGEVGPTTAYLVEAAPAERRGSGSLPEPE